MKHNMEQMLEHPTITLNRPILSATAPGTMRPKVADAFMAASMYPAATGDTPFCKAFVVRYAAGTRTAQSITNMAPIVIENLLSRKPAQSRFRSLMVLSPGNRLLVRHSPILVQTSVTAASIRTAQ